MAKPKTTTEPAAAADPVVVHAPPPAPTVAEQAVAALTGKAHELTLVLRGESIGFTKLSGRSPADLEAFVEECTRDLSAADVGAVEVKPG